MFRFFGRMIWLMIRGWLFWCFDVVVSPFIRNSSTFDQRMSDRWDRLCEELGDLIREGEHLSGALQNRRDLRN